MNLIWLNLFVKNDNFVLTVCACTSVKDYNLNCAFCYNIIGLPIPSSTLCLCSICVWGPPEGRFDLLPGYDIRYFIPGSDSELILSVDETRFYTLTTDEVFSLGPEDQILVQVCFCIYTHWSHAPLIYHFGTYSLFTVGPRMVPEQFLLHVVYTWNHNR